MMVYVLVGRTVNGGGSDVAHGQLTRILAGDPPGEEDRHWLVNCKVSLDAPGIVHLRNVRLYPTEDAARRHKVRYAGEAGYLPWRPSGDTPGQPGCTCMCNTSVA